MTETSCHSDNKLKISLVLEWGGGGPLVGDPFSVYSAPVFAKDYDIIFKINDYHTFN